MKFAIVVKNDIVHLLTKVQRCNQQHGDRDAAGEARQREDDAEHDAGRAQSELGTAGHAGDQR